MQEITHKARDFGNIYRYIFKEKQSSRQQIAECLGISLPTVTQNLKQLQELNLIHISGTYKSSGGRKANIFECVPNARYAVGIDITRNHLNIAIINLHSDIIGNIRRRCPFQDTTEYYQNMYEELEALLSEFSIDKSKLLGVGISFPVIIKPDNKTISYATVINISRNVYQHIETILPYPFLLFNDASSAGLAESWTHQCDKPSAYLSLSGSVGGAFMNPNKLFAGDNNKASEFGHICIVPHGRKCYCGRYGCVDAYCSAKILSDFTNGNLEDFFAELKAGNKGFSHVFDEYLDYLAIVVNNLRMCYDCDIIIGGTVGAHMTDYIDILRDKAISLNPFEENGSFIKSCYYKKAASAVGAAIYFVNQFVREL